MAAEGFGPEDAAEQLPQQQQIPSEAIDSGQQLPYIPVGPYEGASVETPVSFNRKQPFWKQPVEPPLLGSVFVQPTKKKLNSLVVFVICCYSSVFPPPSRNGS